jgi:hypothetical protein
MENNNRSLQTQELKTPFLEILTANNKIQVAARLAYYKNRGEVDFKAVLAIKSAQRIPALVQQAGGRETVLIALSLALKSTMNNLNLKYQMNEDQVVSLADSIIDQSQQDYLALEDIMLFLQKLVAGEYGPVEFKMDAPTFFRFFEAYRQERHNNYLKIREEQEINHKSIGMEREGEETWNDLVQLARKKYGEKG